MKIAMLATFAKSVMRGHQTCPEPERLEQACDAVPEVHEEQPLRDEIEKHHPPDLEAQHYHAVHVGNRFAVQVVVSARKSPTPLMPGSRTVKCARW